MDQHSLIIFLCLLLFILLIPFVVILRLLGRLMEKFKQLEREIKNNIEEHK